VTFASGEGTKLVPFTSIGDTDIEPNETFMVTLTNPTGVALGDLVGDGILYNNDGPTLRVGDLSVPEGNSGTRQAVFVVSLSQPSAAPVSFSIGTVDDSARAGEDYVASTLADQVIPAGMTSKTFAVTINGDTALENTETFRVRLSQATGASILVGQATGEILNDDGPGLSILDAMVEEGDSGTRVLSFVVRLSQAAAGPVSYRFTAINGTAIGGSDFEPQAYDTYIPAGQLSSVEHVILRSDTTVEANETLSATLTYVNGASRYDWNAIGTILNDDGPVIGVGDATVSEGNAGTKVLTYVVNLTRPSAVPITYSISTYDITATAGSDYVARSLVNETIPAGQMSRTFTVTINGDTTVEANETLGVELRDVGAGATVGRPRGTGTITNDD
jgi:hypothetical protein